MTESSQLDIFLAAAPGLEAALAAEARRLGFEVVRPVPGGVELTGDWLDVWRANLELRGAGRVLARFAAFRALHLAQLDKRARRVDWASVIRADVPFRVEATCRKSRIYHSGAAAQRIERAIHETIGCPVSDTAEIVIKARIDDDLCTLAVDTSGEPLHKRGHKVEVGKAPMRETLASLFLGECGYSGTEPVLDPMCGSGTFVIEAAEIASRLKPGRSRHFAFQHLASFDAARWERLQTTPPVVAPGVRFYGRDRDAGAIRMSRANAMRAGLDTLTEFEQVEIADLTAPAGAKGLVILNPPYGDRIGEGRDLRPLYRSLGTVLRSRFAGWRVGLITSDAALAAATSLPFSPPDAPVLHGGLRVNLFKTAPLP